MARSAGPCPSDDEFAAFVEGRTSAAERDALDRHLDACAPCQALVLALLGGDSRADPPPSGDDETLQPEPGSAPTLFASPDSTHRPGRPTEVPARLGRYLVIEVLGAGGMGIVYAAYDPELDRRIAVKVLKTAQGDESVRLRLLQEARAMERLSHTNVVAVYDVGTFDGDVFVAMEYVDGLSLSAWQRAEQRPWREIVEVYGQAARGLAAAHRAGLVHRDFKPHNAMLGDDGVVKVLDFGLARVENAVPALDLEGTDPHEHTPSDLGSLTRTGAVMGTPAYMSPEQFEGRRADPRSDQFSLCVSIYEALYGVLPFSGDSFAALFHNVIHGRVRAADAAHEVPAWLRDAVLRGLEVDADARYPDMETLLAAIVRDPELERRRRRGRVAAVAAVVATGLGVAALAGFWERPCAGIDAELATVWSAQRRASTERAVAQSGVAFAAETWDRVAPALDEYAARWIDQRSESCVAHADDRISDRLYDRQTACLERRRASLEAFVETLTSAADRDVVSKASAAARKLPALAQCADAGYLTSAVPFPEIAEVAEVVEAGRRELARAAELEALGKYDAAVEVAGAVWDGGIEAGYEPLLAESLLQEGSALMMSYEADAANEALTRALWTGLRSAHDPAAAEAAVKRMFVRAELLGDVTKIDEDRALADALVARVDDPRLRNLYFNNLAITEERAGHRELAIDAYERSLAMFGRELPDDDPDLMITLANYGAMLTQSWDFDDGGDKLAAALDRGRTALGADHPQVAAVELLLANSLIWQGRYTKAEGLLEHVERVYRAAPSTDAPALIWAQVARGTIALRQRHYERALDQFARARQAAEAAGIENATYADALHGMADALIGRAGSLEGSSAAAQVREALALHEQGLRARVDKLGAEHGLVGESCTRLAIALVEGAWPSGAERARQCIETALVNAEHTHGPGAIATAQALRAAAHLHERGGDLDDAARALAQAVAIFEGTLNPDAPLLLDARVEYAALLGALSRRDEALSQIDASLARYRSPADRGRVRFERAKLAASSDGCSDAVREDALAARSLVATASAVREIDAWLARSCD